MNEVVVGDTVERRAHSGSSLGRSLRTRPGSSVAADVIVVEAGRGSRRRDRLATEEPLEIRIVTDAGVSTAGITMRTPGNDFELAAGFLLGEQVIDSADDIRQMTYCPDRSVVAEQRYNIVNVTLRRGLEPDPRVLDRAALRTSACGVCGKSSLDALHLRGCPRVAPGPRVSAATIAALPDTLRAAQPLFAATGGFHAAGLFSATGALCAAREDVGRHNAVDKVLGHALLERGLPLHDSLLMVSGRTSYEILQKALVAGVPIVCSVSAPSSLAVGLAQEFGMTLAGFIRGDRFNVYAGPERIDLTI